MESAIGLNQGIPPIRPKHVFKKVLIEQHFAEMVVTPFPLILLVFIKHLCSIYKFTAGLRHVGYTAVVGGTA